MIKLASVRLQGNRVWNWLTAFTGEIDEICHPTRRERQFRYTAFMRRASKTPNAIALSQAMALYYDSTA